VPGRWELRIRLRDVAARIAIREALAFGKAVYDQRHALGLSVTDLAGRADMTVDEIESIEEGGTEPTIALLRRLAAALDSDVRLTPGHDLGSVWFVTRCVNCMTPAHPDVRVYSPARPGSHAKEQNQKAYSGRRPPVRLDREAGSGRASSPGAPGSRAVISRLGGMEARLHPAWGRG
jgi:transcriptional regulator with XRE-family HTH domain